jgi:predicted ATPase
MATTKVPRKKKEQIKRPDLKIGIKDFGPIAEGEIELKPLTVFIGPNNSGKSYAAMLIYSIYESYYSLFMAPKGDYSFKIDHILKDFQELLEKVSSTKEPININITEKMNSFSAEIIKGVYENILSEKIARIYACKLNELNKIDRNSFELKISSKSHDAHITLQNGNIKLRELRQIVPNINIDIKPTKTFNPFTREAEEKIEITFKLEKKSEIKLSFESSILLDIIDPIFRICMTIIFSPLLSSFQYLPASRSDKLQFYKLIAGRTFKQVTSFNIKEQQAIPKLLGTVSDFVSTIIEMSSKEKMDFYQLANELEEKLFAGSIDFISEDKNLLPDIIFRFKGIDIPLQRASSSVSEIAPLILYLKYIIQPGSVLIIEEPEAHLHPANIRILAKYLVRLVNKGVNVLITTHSEYLLEQLDNFVMLSNIDPEEIVERYGYEKDDFLKYTDFAVYEFHYDQNTGTSKIEKARLTKKDGVSQEEFTKILDELYEETDKLRRDLSDE